jgi:hypothetical protein
MSNQRKTPSQWRLMVCAAIALQGWNLAIPATRLPSITDAFEIHYCAWYGVTVRRTQTELRNHQPARLSGGPTLAVGNIKRLDTFRFPVEQAARPGRPNSNGT